MEFQWESYSPKNFWIKFENLISEKPKKIKIFLLLSYYVGLL